MIRAIKHKHIWESGGYWSDSDGYSGETYYCTVCGKKHDVTTLFWFPFIKQVGYIARMIFCGIILVLILVIPFFLCIVGSLILGSWLFGSSTGVAIVSSIIGIVIGCVGTAIIATLIGR